MNLDELKALISSGEGETLCTFLNKDGGEAK